MNNRLIVLRAALTPLAASAQHTETARPQRVPAGTLLLTCLSNA